MAVAVGSHAHEWYWLLAAQCTEAYDASNAGCRLGRSGDVYSCVCAVAGADFWAKHDQHVVCGYQV